jgi:tight adherence protein B
MEVYLIPLLGAVTVFVLISVFFGGDPTMKKIRNRVSHLVSETGDDTLHDSVIREKRRKSKNKNPHKLISRKFEDELTASGIKLNAKEYLSIWVGTTFIPVLLLSLLGKSFITLIGAGCIGFVIPPMLVRRAKKKRQQLFNKQLSEVLVIMGNCIKSGYSFQQAMENISTDMQPPISNEFSFVIREMRYGVKMEDALNHMVLRTQNPDLGLLVSAVLTSSQVGANLTDILDNISSTIKDRLKIRDEVRVLTAQGRMSGIIIGLLPVVIALMLMLMNPDYILTFVSSTLGKIMIAAGAVLEVIGFLAVRKVVDIKY